jgi:hypothetical protein
MTSAVAIYAFSPDALSDDCFRRDLDEVEAIRVAGAGV